MRKDSALLMEDPFGTYLLSESEQMIDSFPII